MDTRYDKARGFAPHPKPQFSPLRRDHFRMTLDLSPARFALQILRDQLLVSDAIRFQR